MDKQTKYGRLRVLEREALFAAKVEAIQTAIRQKPENRPATIAFTGGSTPKAWYPWAVENKGFSEVERSSSVWTVSDERCVPIGHEDSNFGTAERLFLKPLGVGEDCKRPWPLGIDPKEAAAIHSQIWASEFGADAAYDLCILGMGDDGHTASLFPGEPVGEADVDGLFTAVEVPGKGFRLTITPKGLRHCGQILVLVAGKGKAARLNRVFNGPFDPSVQPIQLLHASAAKVTWLVDPEAASAL